MHFIICKSGSSSNSGSNLHSTINNLNVVAAAVVTLFALAWRSLRRTSPLFFRLWRTCLITDVGRLKFQSILLGGTEKSARESVVEKRGLTPPPPIPATARWHKVKRLLSPHAARCSLAAVAAIIMQIGLAVFAHT